jgi:hypothetical protein
MKVNHDYQQRKVPTKLVRVAMTTLFTQRSEMAKINKRGLTHNFPVSSDIHERIYIFYKIDIK